MTGDNRDRNAQDALSHAETCLREAETLQSADLPYGAASRAYYVVFHGARAQLFSVGLEARSHQGLVSLLGEHFVKPGKLPVELGRMVSRMQRDREDADYVDGAVFTEQEAAQLVTDARRFLETVRELLSP